MTLTPEQRLIIYKAQQIKREKNKGLNQSLRAERRGRGKADRGRERDTGFLAYLRCQPCEAAHMGGCSGPVQAAHISYRQAGIPNSFGRGVKNHDRHANPLCAGHHEMQHQMGRERAFWELVGKDAYETAASHYAKYQGHDSVARARREAQS